MNALQTTLAATPARLSSRSGALEQPGDIFVHDERDARPGEHAHEVRTQAAIEPCEALVRPRMRDRRRDGAMVRARQRRVVLRSQQRLVSRV